MDPWGNMVGGKAFLSTRLESVFTGKVKEDDLDLYYFYARFYDPWTMRFVGRDPVAPSLEQPLSLNPFVYGLNNPVKYVDYDGLLPADQLMANTRITSITGQRFHPIANKLIGHKGIDLVGDGAVHAAAAGIVNRLPRYQISSDGTGWGNYLELKHKISNGEEYITRYAHLKELPKFKAGDTVFEGQIIGKMGATGGVHGAHLHFELLRFDTETHNWNAIPQGGDNGLPNIGEFNKLFEIK